MNLQRRSHGDAWVDIDTIEKLTIESFTIDEPKVTWATKDVAMLRYKCDLKG